MNTRVLVLSVGLLLTVDYKGYLLDPEDWS